MSNLSTFSLRIDQLKALARKLRFRIVRTSHLSGTPHLGSCLSCLDLLVYLYWNALRIDPNKPTAALTLPEVLMNPVTDSCPPVCTAALTLPEVLMNPVELTAANVVVPVTFNAPAFTTAPLTLPLVLINPVEVTPPAR